MDDLIEFLNADPLASNAEAEWYRNWPRSNEAAAEFPLRRFAQSVALQLGSEDRSESVSNCIS